MPMPITSTTLEGCIIKILEKNNINDLWLLKQDKLISKVTSRYIRFFKFQTNPQII